MPEYPIALNYHLNLNHRALQPDQREIFLEQTLAELTAEIAVPATISACAEDLLVVRDASPEAWQNIIQNPNIMVAPSFYSHTLAELFPETVTDQALASIGIARVLLPKGKLSPFGYPPELSVPPLDTNAALADIWQGTVYCDARTPVIPERPAHFTDAAGLSYAMSMRHLQYRDAFHFYLRERASRAEVTWALQADAQRLPDGVPLVARIDLETPVFNAVGVAGTPGRPRTDLFARLQQDYLADPNYRFIFLDEEVLECARSTVVSIPPVTAPGATDKWRNESLQSELSLYAGADVGRFAYWSALVSDYFIHPTDDVVASADYHGQEGQIRIRCDGRARAYELSVKMAALACSVPLVDKLDENSNSYLHSVHKASVQAAELLADC